MATWVALGALGELSPGMWEGLRLLEKRWASSKWGDVYVYHKRDGAHSTGSLHYSGNAVDIRFPKSKRTMENIKGIIKRALGPDFDVVIHSGSHVHVEFQPE